METVLTNHAVLLVDENDVVLSAWLTDQSIVKRYIASKPEEWRAGIWMVGYNPKSLDEFHSKALRTISTYGEERGRNGSISKEWAQYWGVQPNQGM